MYSYIRGSLVERATGSIIVENNGIGYSILAPTSTMGELEIGQEVTIRTRLIVKEEEMVLVGFLNALDLEVFDVLRGVSGIGVKLALAMIDALGASGIISVIESEDTDALKSISGVGKKTAQRVVLDLKDKVQQVFKGRVDTVNSGVVSMKLEVQAALESLGYGSQEIIGALKDLDWNAVGESVESYIVKALSAIRTGGRK